MLYSLSCAAFLFISVVEREKHGRRLQLWNQRKVTIEGQMHSLPTSSKSRGGKELGPWALRYESHVFISPMQSCRQPPPHLLLQGYPHTSLQIYQYPSTPDTVLVSALWMPKFPHTIMHISTPKIPHPHPIPIALVSGADEIIRQLLDRLCRISGNHAVFVVGDEDSLCGLDNNDAFSALFPLCQILSTFFRGENGGADLPGIQTSVFCFCKNEFLASNVQSFSI